MLFLLTSAHAYLAAQSAEVSRPLSAGQSRADEIQAARRAKAASIQPPSRKAKAVTTAEKEVSRGYGLWNGLLAGSHGLSLHLGGLAVGSGLALGPEYIYKLGDLYYPWLVWDSYAVASFETYYRLESSVELPRLFTDHAYARVNVVRFDYPRLAYYGPGPESHKTGRSDYRMQDNYANFRVAYKPIHPVQIGLLGGFQNIRIGSGTDPRFASTDATYSLAQAPGLDERANFLNGGFFFRFDGRDNPGDPSSGTFVSTEFQVVDGSRRRLGAFNQYDFEAQQYFHFWNKRRVIATRFKTSLTTPKPGTFVPFYLEPRLGGQDDLRGFRPYRFYDQNSVLVQGEYRWRVMESVEFAFFGDGGKVFHNWQNFSLRGLEADAGFGLRARVGETVPFRLDVGFSREGFQIWAIFYNIF
jgi:outer membrane protein assembly factor BamA